MTRKRVELAALSSMRGLSTGTSKRRPAISEAMAATAGSSLARAAALHLVEDVGDALDGHEAGRRAEAAHRRLVRVRRRGAEVSDRQRMLEGEAGGEDLPPDRPDGVAAQGAPVARDETVEDLGLALGSEVRELVLPLELADLEGGLSAPSEEVEDLFVEVIDPGAPIVQVHRSS